MRKAVFLIIVPLFILAINGCAPGVSVYRLEANIAASRLSEPSFAELFPSEYRDFQETILLGEAALAKGNVADADNQYRFSLLKAEVLESRYREELRRRAEEAQLRLQQEQERQAAEERERLRRLEEAKAAAAAREAAQKAVEAARKRAERPRVQLVSRYTVRRGETLPQIAAQPEVYGDSALWPLIYRANRDQISDPSVLWPGQILRIPR